MNDGPIFIGGLAHSGKTELGLMLSAHPNIVLTRRTYMWTQFYNRYGDLSRVDNFERCLTAMLRHKYMQVLEPDPERIRQAFWQGPPTYAHLFALFHQHYAERVGKPRWADQLGFIEWYAEPIFAAYPKAKMIHMIRDPRNRYEEAMTLTRHRKGKVGWDTARWLYSARLAFQNQERCFDRYKVVRYETLMSQPEETVREICAFLNEDFVPAMVTRGEAGRGEDRRDEASSEWGTNSDNGVHQMMSKRELAFTQAYARPHMLALGYLLKPAQLSFRERLLLYLVDWPLNWAGMMAWHTLKTRQSG